MFNAVYSGAVDLVSRDTTPSVVLTPNLRFFPRATPSRFTVNTLAKDKRFVWPAYIKSSDPTITGLEKYQVNENDNFILLATTSFNSVAVACELAKKNKSLIVPQLILMDNGAEASIVWKAFTTLFEDNTLPENFDIQLNDFITKHQALLSRKTAQPEVVKIHLAGTCTYVRSIITTYGYQFIRSILLQTIYIEQDWIDKPTFIELKKFIAASNCQNVFVYASNIASLNNEQISLAITENIYSLAPALTIHTNFNLTIYHADTFLMFEEKDNQPANVLNKLADAFGVDTNLYPDFDGYLVFQRTKEESLAASWAKMHTALNNIFKSRKYHFNQANSFILFDSILKLADCAVPVEHYNFEPAAHSDDIIFHLQNSLAEVKTIIDDLNNKFPTLLADFAIIKQAAVKPDFPIRIRMRIDVLIEKIIPLMPQFFDSHPEFIEPYKLNASNFINHLFKSLNMSTSHSDCFEETLCYLVDQRLKSRNINISNLMSTTSRFCPDPKDKSLFNIFLSIPLASAQHVVDYFNEISPNSARLHPEAAWDERCRVYFATIFVLNSTILNERFVDDIKATVASYPPEILARYQKLAKPAEVKEDSFVPRPSVP
jgi:hypothetical protein